MSSLSMFVIFMTLSSSFTVSVIAHLTLCSEPFFLVSLKKNFTNCKKLVTLEAEFAWKITGAHQVEIFFGKRLYADMGWLAWGVNPGKMPQMVGTRAIIGIKYSNGSTFIGTYYITRDTKMGCKLQPKNFNEIAQNEVEFHNMSMEYITELDYITIRARVILPPAAYNITMLNHVWQIGYGAEGTEPKQHPTFLQNVDSTETIDLRTGRSRQAGKRIYYMRSVHGILSIVGWGTFLPFGVIIARYFKYPLETFRYCRFRIHVSCQIAGYIIGTLGWILGLYLGNLSKFYVFETHRLYSIFIFAFTTLQMLALRLRPRKEDDYRKYWNMYHHFLGYALLAVISINIFNGIGILKPDMTWRKAYMGILLAFAAIVTVLEIYTWAKFKSNAKTATSIQDGTAAIPLAIPQPRP
ncbi:cytochrome b561 and DOMON domain-containing protein At5g47530 [Manihot esculenta]|uniref:Cytochrome b561 and DOMON domain-containing protein n=1 Tax=Manihot esculenta TaxID=3983 RepID=A0A2C9UER2_MANES|nr:cytochrome b561 and DOMON domain-containing protein At5g47530 [Manihot esculenta]OAY28458.1 hypothetical protein MANES_15G068400v8 [Manihot esculenta]